MKIVVGRCSMRAEACLRRCVDLMEIRILVVVGAKQLENSCHRKSNGSLTMSISQGVVGPNLARNSSHEKGKTVNIPLLSLYVRRRKVLF